MEKQQTQQSPDIEVVLTPEQEAQIDRILALYDRSHPREVADELIGDRIELADAD